MVNPLNILSIGAGAIGTYVGGSLDIVGHRVVFLVRPEHRDEIREYGFEIQVHQLIHKIPDPIIAYSMEDALQKGPYDLALFALKSYDTDPFLETILPYKEILPPVLCLSNGVENESKLADILGWDRVISGTITSAVSRQQVGRVTVERLRGVGIAAGHRLSNPITIEMNRAGLNARRIEDSESMKWSKLLTNLIANASSAILAMHPTEIYANPDLFQIEYQQLMETLHVMKAQRMKVINLPGIPVKLLDFSLQFLPRKITRYLLMQVVGSGRGEKMPSLYLDLDSGRGKTEGEYLNGAVVRAGLKFDIPAPVNRILKEIVVGLTAGKIDWKRYQRNPEYLISQFKIPNRKSLN